MKGVTFIITLVVFAICLVLEYGRLTTKPWPPKTFSDPAMEFKYGSIGAEVDGFPYQIWRELPTIFHDRIPAGWRQFGFIYEGDRELPIGISVRRTAVDRVGFNCATCHTSTYTLNGAQALVLGAPANQLNIQAYLQFIAEAGNDPRLTPDAVFNSAEAAGRPINWLSKLVIRYVIFPRLPQQMADLKQSFGWMARRPAHGPGRTDAGNFWRERWGLHPENDDLVGAVDFPSVWHQRIRLNGWFHWDGDNSSLTERNYSAALAGGATDWLLDRWSIDKMSDWLLDLPPPKFPTALDAQKVELGAKIYQREGCGGCHDATAGRFGQVTDLSVVQTDPQRVTLFSPQMVQYFQQVGAGYSWHFTHYRSTHGYANMALDGIWMRAPYLHNGSVPSLDTLLSPAKDRPRTFIRGCDRFDPMTVGFACSQGFEYDTGLAGNSNERHEFGTMLPPAEKSELIEYLRSL